MLKENVLSILDCPEFNFAGTDHTIEYGRFVPHDLFFTSKKIKTGTAIEIIDKYDESITRGHFIQLEFYSPHGLIMQAPIFRLGEVHSQELYDEIEILVTLTQEQLWALNLDRVDISSFGY